MKKEFILLFILFFSLNSFSQKKFSAEILTGIGFNKNLSLINQNIEDYDIFTTQVNTNYKFKLYKNIFAETGVGIQWYFSSGNIGLSNFKSTSLRLNLPFIISYSILGKINIGGGVAITNNRDFKEFELKARNLIRTSLMFKGSYALLSNIDILLIIKQNVSNISNSFLVNHPNTDVSLGISYKLF